MCLVYVFVPQTEHPLSTTGYEQQDDGRDGRPSQDHQPPPIFLRHHYTLTTTYNTAW